MKPWLRTFVLLGVSSLLLGGDCMFGRPIVDDKDRYYPTDGVISCTGTRCASLPSYELELPAPIEDSRCTQDVPAVDLVEVAQAARSVAGMRLVLHSERPLDIHLDALDLQEVCLVLSGPVDLTLGANSKLTDVTVMLGSAWPSGEDAGVGDLDAGLDASAGHPPSDAAQETPDGARPSDAGEGRSDGGLDAAASDAGPDPRDAEVGGAIGQVRPMASGFPKATPVAASSRMPNLYLGYAQLERVVIRPFEEEQPSGSAQIEFSTCTQCEIGVDFLSVAESSVRNSRFHAGMLDVFGGAFDTVELSFGRGRLAGIVANNLRTITCKTLSLLGSTIAGRASQIGPCDCGLTAPDAAMDAGQFDASQSDAGPLETGPPEVGSTGAGEAYASCRGATLSKTTFLAGMLEGKLHAEDTTFQSVLFARHASTSLDLSRGEVRLSVICEQPMDIRLGDAAEIACTSCDQPEEVAACASKNAPSLVANPCKPFGSKLPMCEPVLPTMANPFMTTP